MLKCAVVLPFCRCVHLPTSEQLRDLLQMLLGRNVTITREKGFHTFLRRPSAVGVFEAADDTIIGCCACDLTLASHAGAALAMIPQATAEAATASGQLDATLADHMQEVMGLLASTFPDAAGEPVRLAKMHRSPPLPRTLMPVMKTPSERVDLHVDVEGYATGLMILFAA